MQPLVSILIPAYNAEKWIGDTIRSAIQQTWSNREIIIVDDGSKDSTLSIAKSFASASVKIISQENKGASAARNTAYSHAQGDFIQWLDADDLLAPDKIEQQIKRLAIENSNMTLYSSAFGFFYYRYQKSKFKPNNLWQDLPPLDWMIIKFRENLWMSLDAWLISRTLTDLAGRWNEKLSRDDDGEYICRVVLACNKIVFVPEAISYCRIGNLGSLSTRRNYEACVSLFLSHSSCIEQLCKMENSERTKKASLSLLQRWFIYYYPDYPDLIEKVINLARELGGELHCPTLKWKYNWIKEVFGWKPAKIAQQTMPKVKTVAHKSFDKLLHSLRI